MITYTPNKKNTYALKLTLNSPMSHGDPAQVDKSNAQLFRRQSVLLKNPDLGQFPTQEEVNKYCDQFMIPADLHDFFKMLNLPQFVAVTILKLFISEYGGGEGSGLFSGMARYTYLQDRFQHAAIQASTLPDMWSLACGKLLVKIGSMKNDKAILSALGVKQSLAQGVLHEVATNPQVLVMAARAWNDEEKNQNKDYVKAFGGELADSKSGYYQGNAEDLHKLSAATVRIPTISGNSIRHEMARIPLMWHLLQTIGIELGEDALPSGVLALLENGNNIEGGVKSPDDTYRLSQIVREKFPSISLLGGCTDSWILFSSNLSAVNAWLVCSENNDATDEYGITSHLSAFDLIDSWTLTRHADLSDVSPMPYSFETVVKGAEIVVSFTLSPYATDLERGALLTAIETFQNYDMGIAGKGARGFGNVSVEWITELTGNDDLYCMNLYKDYVSTNAKDLKQWLIDGTLGTGKAIFKIDNKVTPKQASLFK